MVNVYSTVILVIFLLALIVANVTALTVHKKKKINAQNYDKNRKDKALMAGMKAYSKDYYIRNNKRIKSMARIAYKINRKNKLAAASALSKLKPGYIKENLEGGIITIETLNSLSQDSTQNLSTCKIIKEQESVQQLILVRMLNISNKGQGNIRL